MNKVLKMESKGQTVLSAIVVFVGMVLLVPVITENALATVHATASGQCGPEGQTHPCDFTLVNNHLDLGYWISEPSKSGTLVTWSTAGGERGGGAAFGPPVPMPGDEKGSVTYKVGEETAVLSFVNPVFGFNKCSVSGIDGSCTASTGQHAVFTYSLRGR